MQYYALIRRARIEGFKSIKSLDLELKPGLNVLVGGNAAGKTNILEALYFMRHALIDEGGSTPYRPHAPLYWSGLDLLYGRDPSTLLRLGLIMDVQRVKGGTCDLAVFEYTVTFAYDEASDTVYPVSHVLRINDDLVFEVSIDVIRVYTRYEIAKRAGLGDGEREGEWFVSEAPWKPPRPLIPWRAPIFSMCDSRGDLMVCEMRPLHGHKVEFAAPEDVFVARCTRPRGYRYSAPPFWRPSLLDFFMHVSRVLGGVIMLKHPDIAAIGEPRPFTGSKTLDVRARNLAEVLLSLVAERGALPERMDHALRTLFPGYSVRVETGFGRVALVAFEDGLRLPPPNMPDGLVKLLAVLAAVELNPSLLLIDEIENSLHARIIEYLVDELNALPIPVLVATHSPIPIDLVDPSDVIVVKRSAEGTIASRLPDPQGLREVLAREGILLSDYVIYHETRDKP